MPPPPQAGSRIPGETKVYLLTEITDSFFYGVNQFVSNVIFDAGLTEEQKDEAVFVKAELGGTLNPQPIVIESNPYKNVETHPAGYVDKAITSPYFAGASVSVDNAFPSGLTKILASSVEAVVTDPAQLAQYGAHDNPTPPFRSPSSREMRRITEASGSARRTTKAIITPPPRTDGWFMWSKPTTYPTWS